MAVAYSVVDYTRTDGVFHTACTKFETTWINNLHGSWARFVHSTEIKLSRFWEISCKLQASQTSFFWSSFHLLFRLSISILLFLLDSTFFVKTTIASQPPLSSILTASTLRINSIRFKKSKVSSFRGWRRDCINLDHVSSVLFDSKMRMFMRSYFVLSLWDIL